MLIERTSANSLVLVGRHITESGFRRNTAIRPQYTPFVFLVTDRAEFKIIIENYSVVSSFCRLMYILASIYFSVNRAPCTIIYVFYVRLFALMRDVWTLE